MANNSITVVGSSNTDMVIKSSSLPVPGETIIGGKFLMNPGGKGANQAVACARLGGQTTFITKTGNDIFGKQAVQLFEKESINTRYVATDPNNPSGVALIMVDNKGENCISVALGANGTLMPADLDGAKEQILQSKFVLMQLEIPLSTVEYVAKLVKETNTKVILNPAPAQGLSIELLQSIHILTPNESEAELLTGIKVNDIATADEAAQALLDKGIETVIITMGAKGSYLKSADGSEHIPAPVVSAVDTTAAGDTFNGALCAGLAEDMTIADAIRFASKAASISVTRMGAQSSVPYRKEIIGF